MASSDGDDEPMPSRLPSLRQPPIGFAHRGARAHERDNTLAAFALALRLGATGLETDVWLTADGKVVLDHDGKAGRWPRRRPLATLARVELASHIPTIDELFDTCGTDFELSVDVKDPRAAAPLAAAARERGVAERLWMCHHDLATLTEWRELADDVNLVHSTRLSELELGPERHAFDLSEARIDAVNLREPDWTGGLAALYHRFDIVGFGWDAQYERQLDRLIDLGIDGVFSDHVDRMCDVLARFGYGA